MYFIFPNEIGNIHQCKNQMPLELDIPIGIGRESHVKQ